MPGKVRLHEEAGSEYDAAFDWYLARSEDAVLRFTEEFDRALIDIARAPQRWAAASHSTRRYLLRKFPYIVVYHEWTPGDIQIIALAHTSRKPGNWKGRI